MSDQISGHLETVLADEGEGWGIANYVTIVGVERLNDDGELETDCCIYTPQQQPDYITKGLMQEAFDHKRRT